MRTTGDFYAEMSPPAGAPPRRPDSGIVASLTRACRAFGEVLYEQLRGYDECYAQFLASSGSDRDASPRPTGIAETVPVAHLRGAGRTLAEADAELARIRATLAGGDRGDGEDGGWDQVLDPARQASLSSFLWGASPVPVAYEHMLWARPNGQGTLVQQFPFPMDRCPAPGNQRQTYHTLQPLPFFPPAHAGYGRKYYR